MIKGLPSDPAQSSIRVEASAHRRGDTDAQIVIRTAGNIAIHIHMCAYVPTYLCSVHVHAYVCMSVPCGVRTYVAVAVTLSLIHI